MLLYKFTSNLEIAKQISIGIFRFYELTKYIKIEDSVGRSDPAECSVSFSEKEYLLFPEKIPIASFNGVEFKCVSIQPGDDHIKQYFVFCMSTTVDAGVMGDSKYVVDLDSNIFDIFEMLLCSPERVHGNDEGYKFFSHGPVAYYDIHAHPEPLLDEKWREAYIKHSNFKHQHEYRAALFGSDYFFNRVRNKPMVIERGIYDSDYKRRDFNLKLSVQSGIDADGWRYLEFDISEFAANLLPDPFNIQILPKTDDELMIGDVGI